MDRRSADRVLEEWDSVTRNAQRPDEAPRRRAVRGSFGLMTLAPLVAAALVVAIGVIWLGGREAGVGTASPSPAPSTVTALASPSPSPSPSPIPSPSPSPLVTAPPTPSPTPEATASPAPSDECGLSAAITAWEGAAGSRIATIQLTSNGPQGCSIRTLPSARLIDGTGRVLAQIVNPDNGGRIDLAAGDVVSTVASVSNVCGGPPAPPVTIQLDLGDQGVITARPLNPTDATVPPCNGPTQPAEMSIHPWSR
jgi:hypothetical protein